MYRKYKITGIIEVVTGLHIGGSTQYSPIGSVDAPVIRDTLTNEPIIPGSSLKGKMRSLLALSENNGHIVAKPIFDEDCIKRLFGASRPSKQDKDNDKNKQLKDKVIPARLQFRDMKVKDAEKLMEERFLDSLTEVKFENKIDRDSGAATPRQIERVVPGVEFELDIIYNAIFDEEKVKANEIVKEMEDDFNLLNDGFRLLQYDYLGGNGSRGHGKVKFKDLQVKCVFDSKEKENSKAEQTEVDANKNEPKKPLEERLKEILNSNLNENKGVSE